MHSGIMTWWRRDDDNEDDNDDDDDDDDDGDDDDDDDDDEIKFQKTSTLLLRVFVLTTSGICTTTCRGAKITMSILNIMMLSTIFNDAFISKMICAYNYVGDERVA